MGCHHGISSSKSILFAGHLWAVESGLVVLALLASAKTIGNGGLMGFDGILPSGKLT